MNVCPPLSFNEHAKRMEQDKNYFYEHKNEIFASLTQHTNHEEDRLNFLNFIYISNTDKDMKDDFIGEALSGNHINLMKWHQYNNLDFLNKHIASFYYDTDYQYLIDYVRNNYVNDLRNILELNNKHSSLKVLFNEYNCISAGYDNDIFLLATFHALTHDTQEIITDLFKQLPFSFLHSQSKQHSISFDSFKSRANTDPLIINTLLNDYYKFAPLEDSFIPKLVDMILVEIKKEKPININKNSFLSFLFKHMEINGYMSKFIYSVNEKLIENKETPKDTVEKEQILFFVDALFNTLKNSNFFNDHNTALMKDFNYEDLRKMEWSINQIKKTYHTSFRNDYSDLYEKTEYLINIQFEKESLSLITNQSIKSKNVKRI